YRVPGRKAAPKRRFSGIEKRVVEGCSRRHFRWPFPPSNRLNRKTYDIAVCVSLSCQQSRFTCVSVAANLTNQKKCCGHNRDFRVRNWPVKRIVEVIEIPRVSLEIRHRMGVSDNQRRGSPDHGECRNPVTPFRKMRRKEPNIFLVVNDFLGELLPGKFNVTR